MMKALISLIMPGFGCAILMLLSSTASLQAQSGHFSPASFDEYERLRQAGKVAPAAAERPAPQKQPSAVQTGFVEEGGVED